MSERLQGELDRLKQRESELKQQLGEQRRQLKAIQERKVAALRNQMRRVQSRLNTQERKRDTRWKILIGGPSWPAPPGIQPPPTAWIA